MSDKLQLSTVPVTSFSFKSAAGGWRGLQGSVSTLAAGPQGQGQDRATEQGEGGEKGTQAVQMWEKR